LVVGRKGVAITRRGAFVLAVVAAALAAVATVHAGDGKEQIRFNAADQAAARAVVIRRADLGSGWAGGPAKPDLSAGPSCPDYQPKVSDLVLTGAARTTFQRSGFEFDSQSGVLKTRRMVALDWRRSVLAPGVVPCLRRTIGSGLGPNAKVVSFKKLPFPKLATYNALFRDGDLRDGDHRPSSALFPATRCGFLGSDRCFRPRDRRAYCPRVLASRRGNPTRPLFVSPSWLDSVSRLSPAPACCSRLAAGRRRSRPRSGVRPRSNSPARVKRWQRRCSVEIPARPRAKPRLFACESRVRLRPARSRSRLLRPRGAQLRGLPTGSPAPLRPLRRRRRRPRLAQ